MNSYRYLLLILFMWGIGPWARGQVVYENGEGKLGVHIPEGDGYVDVLPAEYSRIYVIEGGYLLCKAPEGDRFEHSQEQLGLLKPRYENLWVPVGMSLEEVADPEKSNVMDHFEFRDGWKYGFYPWDVVDDAYLPAIYNEIWPMGHNGLMQVYDGRKYRIWDVYRHKFKKTASDTRFAQLIQADPESGYVFKEGGLYGLVNPDGELALKPKYENLMFYHDMIIVKSDRGWQFMYPDVFELINTKPYDELYLDNRVEGGILFKQAGKFGMLNEYGDPGVFAAEYDSIMQLMPYVYGVKINGKWGVTHSDDGGIEEPFAPFIYDSLDALPNIKDYVGYYRNGKMGVMTTDSWKEILEPLYDMIQKPRYENATYSWVYAFDHGKVGLLREGSFEQLMALKYDSIIPYPQTGLVGAWGFVVKENGLYGYVDASYQEVIPAVYGHIQLSEEGRKIVVEKDGAFGSYDIQAKEIRWLREITHDFPLKWKARIGQTTFRTNMMLEAGRLLIGSNGKARNSLSDEEDGLLLIDPHTGEVEQRVQPEPYGDTDVNGMACFNGQVYFGNDQGKVYCYDIEGNKLWERELGGDIEGSPVLADMRGTAFAGQKLKPNAYFDVVVAIEGDKKVNSAVFLLNGKSGEVLWKFEPPHGGYFTATPAVQELYEGTPTVYIGTGGSPWFYAIDGIDGALKWEFKMKSSAGFVDGSAVHASALIFNPPLGTTFSEDPYVLAAECYGIAHFINANTGVWEMAVPLSMGVFSSPVMSLSGTMVNGGSWWNDRGALDISLAHMSGFDGGRWAPSKATNQEGEAVFRLEDEYTKVGAASYKISASAVIADVLGKGSPQFLIADEKGKMQVISDAGEVMKEWMLPAGVEATAWVGDLDQDGKLELVVACLDGYLYCYDTESEGKVQWGQFRGNPRNTGRLVMDE